MQMSDSKPQSLLANSRFYVLCLSILMSVAVTAVLRQQIASDQLFYIRAQQVFGLLSLVYWYVALIISPLGYVVGKQRLQHLAFARRAIGVVAAYFALLHAAVALWGQLGGVGELALLPSLFRWSLAGGGVALLVLIIMAATSFDKVVRYMTYKKWKWLHRLVYGSLVMVILHIWTIGTHLAYREIQLLSFGALIILFGLELVRVIKLVNARYLHMNTAEAFVLWFASWIMAVTAVFLMPYYFNNYHSRHVDHGDQGSGIHTDHE